MQTSVTKNTTIISKIKKHKGKTNNLFGVGLTSLIAACGLDTNVSANKKPDDNNTNNDDNVNDDEDIGSTPGSGTSGSKALKPSEASSTNGEITTDISGDASSLTVAVKEAGTTKASLTFSGGEKDSAKVGVHKLTNTDTETDINAQYDLVVSSPTIDNDKGGIFIFWNVKGVQDETISTGSTTTTNQRLKIKGANADNNTGSDTGDQIGIHAPEFLQIGGKDGYDMVIRSYLADKAGTDATLNVGAIYVLWDIADYAEASKVIDLGALGTANENATAGSLAIYGVKSGDRIGAHAPEFLQTGSADNNFDMIIRLELIDRDSGGVSSTGAIYILRDVADYQKETLNKAITLDGNLDNDAGGKATAGSLLIYGAKTNDQIGIHTSEFLQIGGKDDNYDMVIRSHKVDKDAVTAKNTGAIYVLWDVKDYYGTGTDANQIIDLTSANATSGLLTIYGKEAEAELGSDGNNILYNADGALTNIDGDGDGTAGSGTIDIAFRDGSYTYILFGDKVATTTGAGVDEKVDSKTVDLAVVETSLGAGAAGFFGYDFGNGNVDNVGYRFVGRKTDLDAVQTDYDGLPSSLSDTDSDIAVWDIA